MLRLSKAKARLLLATAVFVVVLLDHSLLTESSFWGRKRFASLNEMCGTRSTVNSANTNHQDQHKLWRPHSSPLQILIRGGGASYDDYGDRDEEESFSSDQEDRSENEIECYDDDDQEQYVEEDIIRQTDYEDGGDDVESGFISSQPIDNESIKKSPESSASRDLAEDESEGKGRKANRHTSDIILELDRRSSVSRNDESLALRQMITERTTEYVYELQELASHLRQSEDASKVKLPHPRKLLHTLAKKVPAIKQSPDVNLRIHSSRSDIDPGIAACIIGRLAFACEQYEQVQKTLSCEPSTISDSHTENNEDNENGSNKLDSTASQIITDRRFEQLVECVISGVNVKKRKAESVKRELDDSSDEISNDIEEVLDEEDVQCSEGLNIRDACRAAWGIAILGAHYLDTMGGVVINDLLLALSLRIRELLLARLQLLRQGDILSSDVGSYYQDGAPSEEKRLVSPEERLNELAEELAEDAASAMWAFGCVKACTGIKSNPLFEACCSILCQDPVDLRRRAQEAEYEPERSLPIGSSDVVDRLAHSEAVAAGEESQPSKNPKTIEVGAETWHIGNKDAFLDWLSPIEVTDILWALALHGSNATSPKDKDEVTLSETAATLRETAYDRLVEWLDEDLADDSTENEKLIEETDDMTVVEVVDAAALLASEEDKPTKEESDAVEKNPPIQTESITMKTSTIGTHDRNSQEVEVVDAATLLASSDSTNESRIVVETEVMVAPTSLIEGSTVDKDSSIDFNERRRRHIFSPHDLASIAWSVTELRDPLRVHIVGTIIELFWRLGPDGITGLSGADLSNLAWAIAKYEGENHDAYSLSITRWIADHALQRTAKYPLLRIFQPPELGRIMWAIACTASTHASAHENATGNKMSGIFLTRKALKSAVNNLTLFSTETLVRIAWAHIEINEVNLGLLDSFETMALGKILAAAEHSLHRWERVDFATDQTAVDSYAESPLFSSFFGRSRINLPILEQAVNDDEDEDDMAMAPLGRPQRPKLRDLMIDPSTLCKAACGFQRLSKKHPYIKGGWTFTRVAVRLLSSKNARLMKECSVHDIVRLCEAAVLSDVDGHGRELIIGVFARQVVKVLNVVLDETGHCDTSINIESASSFELSTLLWALGEMGAKYAPIGPGKQLPSKKMRLVYIDRLLRGIRTKSLNLIGLERLIRGFALLKIIPHEQSFLLSVLMRVEEELQNVSNGSELCNLAEAIGILKEASKVSLKKQESDDDEDTSHMTLAEDGDSSPAGRDDGSLSRKISVITDEILVSIATQCVDFSETLTANEIRRILEVYSLLPFQADDMIECLSEEISFRLKALQNLKDQSSLGELLMDASKKSTVVKNSLFDDSSTSIFGSIKARLVSIFGTSHADEEDAGQIDDEGTKMTEEIASIVQDAIKASSDAAQRAEDEQRALKLSLNKITQALEEGSSFELGRSQELIENYHRTEFATGQRRSRFEKDRKNYIAKRVLSRLFP